jgi:hypothetical protein
MSAEDSPSCLLRLRLTSSSSWIALFNVFAFSFLGRFLFCLFVFRHTASCGVQACSALIEMAQIKPSSSRAMAVMIFL